MVSLFKCDLCGVEVDYETNAALVSKGEKHADLCPRCLPRVEEFIREEKETVNSPANTLGDAISFVKKAGFIVYRKKGGLKK